MIQLNIDNLFNGKYSRSQIVKLGFSEPLRLITGQYKFIYRNVELICDRDILNHFALDYMIIR